MSDYRPDFGHIPQHKLLSDSETKLLLEQAQQGDHHAQDRLVQHNLRLVMKIAHRFKNSGYEMEDIFQVGTIGLMKAIRDFDLSRGLRFSTYAVPRIIGEIRRFLRDDGPVKVTRTLKESANHIRKFKDTFIKEEGREPTVVEISEGTGLDKENIVQAMEALQTPASLYSPVYEKDGDEILLVDQLQEIGFAEGETIKIALREVIAQLDPQSQKIIYYRYFQEKTQTEIGELLGVSQVHVSRLEKKVLQKIRDLMT